jgi:hypothetical protein
MKKLISTILILIIGTLYLPNNASADISIAFLQSAESGTDASSYTFSTQNIGVAATDRHIIVATIARGASQTLTGVTIGGVTATSVANNSNDGSIAALFIAAVPTGTTGDIVLTFSGTMIRAADGAYRATGLGSATPTDTGVSSANAPTTDLDIAAGGFGIGTAFSGGTAPTFTWTGLTENFDAGWAENSDTAYTGAMEEFATAQTGLTITADSGTGVTNSGAFASWEGEGGAAKPRRQIIQIKPEQPVDFQIA